MSKINFDIYNLRNSMSRYYTFLSVEREREKEATITFEYINQYGYDDGMRKLKKDFPEYATDETALVEECKVRKLTVPRR